MKRAAIAIAATALASCVTTKLNERSASVQITANAEAVRGCRYVGEVHAADRMNGGLFGQDAAEENTYRRMRNQAAELGASIVLLHRAETGYNGASARGEAYACKPD